MRWKYTNSSKIKCVFYLAERMISVNHEGQKSSGGGGLLKLDVNMLVLSSIFDKGEQRK